MARLPTTIEYLQTNIRGDKQFEEMRSNFTKHLPFINNISIN